MLLPFSSYKNSLASLPSALMVGLSLASISVKLITPLRVIVDESVCSMMSAAVAIVPLALAPLVITGRSLVPLIVMVSVESAESPSSSMKL